MELPSHFTLQTGAKIPSVGYGTGTSDTTGYVETLKTALEVGYRHYDGAWKYGVDKEVGEAIKSAGIPRDELFITSKVWPNFARDPELSLDISLSAMNLDYVDLLLIHWPLAFVPNGDLKSAEPRSQTPEKTGIKWKAPDKPEIDVEYTENIHLLWKKMEELQRKGKAKALGVSNFSIKDLEKLMPHVSSDTPICINQVELNPWFANTQLFEYCQSKNIIIEAYSPMRGWTKDESRRNEDGAVSKIASQRGWEPSQVVQSWAVQKGIIPLGRSSKRARMQANFDVKRLTEEEMKAIDALDRGEDGRDVRPDWGWPLYQ